MASPDMAKKREEGVREGKEKSGGKNYRFRFGNEIPVPATEVMTALKSILERASGQMADSPPAIFRN
jgi:hypothetical protein